MSREIKFRAWDIKWEFMTAEVSLKDLAEGFAGIYGEDKIVMQYTGLKDKNGKEIYEGDIARLNSINYEIIYRRYHACFMFQHKHYSGEVFFHFFHEKGVGNWENTEIIGNIYQNPELIGGENE